MKKWRFLSFLFIAILAACGNDILDDLEDDLDLDLDTQTITISFDTQGGNTLQALEISTDATSVNLPTPVRDGYVFVGWYLNEALTQEFIQSVIENGNNVTLYARWQAVDPGEVIVSFDTLGGTQISAVTLDEGDTLTLPNAPTKEGYIFEGWFTDAALSVPFIGTTPITENLTLYARWLELYTVTFDSQGSVFESVTVNEIEDVVAPSAPTKTGYTFNAWFSDEALTSEVSFPLQVSENTIFYAKFTPNEYMINLFVEGELFDTIIADFETDINTPDGPVMDGYTFIGWFDSIAGESAFVFDTMPLDGATVYGLFTVNEYTITFITGEGSQVDDIVLDFQETLTAPEDPTRQGYVFAGWYKDATYAELFNFTVMPLDGATVYARWIEEGNVYTVTFIVEDEVFETLVFDGETIVIPDFEIEPGFVLVDWLVDDAPFDTEQVITEPLTVVAVIEPLVYNLYFNTIGPAMDEFEADYQSLIEAPLVPEYEGYRFAGWYQDEDYTTIFVWDTMPLGDQTIFMKWVAEDAPLSILEIIASDAAFVDLENVRVTFSLLIDVDEDVDSYLVIVTDGTASLIVYSNTEFNVGDTINLEGTLIREFNIPSVAEVTNYTLLSSDSEYLPEYTEIDFKDLLELDFNDPLNVGTFYLITGFVLEDFTYIFLDLETDHALAIINLQFDESLKEDFDLLETYYVKAGMMFFPPIDDMPYLFYIPTIQVVEEVPLTSSEKFDFIQDVLKYFVESLPYEPYDFIGVPNSEPFFGMTIELEAMGANAHYFDQETGQFKWVTETTEMLFKITLTLENESVIFDVTATIEPYERTPINALEDNLNRSSVIEGTVIEIAENFVWLQDDTGIVGLYYYEDLVVEVGKHYVFEIVPYADGKLITGNVLRTPILVGDGSEHLATLTIDLAMLDDFENFHTAYFLDVEGVLENTFMTNMPFHLDNGNARFYLHITDPTLIDALNNHIGEWVSLSGLIKEYLSYFNPSGYVIYFNETIDDITVSPVPSDYYFDLTINTLLEYLPEILRPNNTYLLPTIYNEVELSYTIDLAYSSIAALLNDEDTGFETFEEGLFVLEVTMTLGDDTETFIIELIVEDYTITSIENARLLDAETEVTLELVVAANSYSQVLIGVDDTGYTLFGDPYNYGFNIWPEIGQKIHVTGYFTTDERGREYFEVLMYEAFIDSGQALPFTPEITTISTILENFENDTVYFVEVTGFLEYFGSDIGLFVDAEFEGTAIRLYIEGPIKSPILNEYFQQEITVVGFVTITAWGEIHIAYHQIIDSVPTE